MAQNEFPPKSEQPTPSSGYAAEVSGAPIADLIQIHCMTRARVAFEVRSEKQRGYLFFDQGRLVHAELGGLSGVRAVAVMLGLGSSRFIPASPPWPARPTITCSCEALLSRAAQELDDFQRDDAQIAGDGRTLTAHELPTQPTSLLPPPTRLQPPPRASGSAISQPASGVKLDANGVLVTAMGPQAEAVAETTAFVGPLATLIGEELGLGDVVVVDVSCSDERGVILHRESAGSWIGASGSSKQLAALRKRMGAE